MSGRAPDPAPQLPERALRQRLCVAVAARDEDALAAAMEALSGASDAIAVEEALLQSYLFVGYPVALNTLALWRARSGRPAPLPSEDDWELWTRRGADVCRQVYGGQYGELRENVRALHPDLKRWMVAEGYGKVLGRGGLDLRERELCIVAMLVVLDTPWQLYSHLRSALSTGASEAEAEEALREAFRYAAAPARERAWAVWERVRQGALGS